MNGHVLVQKSIIKQTGIHMSSLSLSAILTIVDEATRPLKMIRQYSDNTENSIDDLNHSINRLNQTLGGSNTQRYSQSLKQTEKNNFVWI